MTGFSFCTGLHQDQTGPLPVR